MTTICGRRISLVPNDGKAKRPSTHNSQLEKRKEGRRSCLRSSGSAEAASDTDASIRVREGRGLYYRSSWTKRLVSYKGQQRQPVTMTTIPFQS